MMETNSNDNKYLYDTMYVHTNTKKSNTQFV